MAMATLLDRVGKREAWHPDALIAAGFSEPLVRRAIVDGPRAVPERARLSLDGRTRTQPMTRYVWGPDFAFLVGAAEGVDVPGGGVR